MFIICYGDIADGHTFVGPFPTHDAALSYMEQEPEGGATIVPLWKPDAPIAVLTEYADDVRTQMTTAASA